MSFLRSVRVELIKTRRSAAFWICFLGGGFIPFVFFLQYMIKPDANAKKLAGDPWVIHIGQLWQTFSVFLLPMFIILTCSLIVQLEYKNNTWKQVFSSPRTYTDIYFSKLAAIFGLIILLFLVFNILSIVAAIVPDLVYNKKLGFINKRFSWLRFLNLNIRLFIACWGIIAIQYWISLRFKNLVVPIGIGLACLIITLIAMGWEHIFKVPYAFPFLTFQYAKSTNGFLQNHEWNAIGYCLTFILIGLYDLIFRKEKG